MHKESPPTIKDREEGSERTRGGGEEEEGRW
jgi:hypothetical protein